MGQAGYGGYVADLPYTHGYYHELAPPYIRFGLLLQGLEPGGGDPSSPYHYCELGYGQGVSANLHAAANPQVRFWGTDFHPEHARFAQDLARRAELSAQWLSCGFDALLGESLPQFDCVALHGVWSWVNDEARQALVEFLRCQLKPGGVVYLSHNVMPGWAAEKPLRDLMRLHTELASAPGDATTDRIEGAVAFAQRLRQGHAAYFDTSPQPGQMLDHMARDDILVVAHEYFNRAWHIPYFSDLAEALAPAGLQFAGSLHQSDLAGEVRQRLQASALDFSGLDPALRETAHDFLLNRRFRRDLFVRGAQRLSPEAWEARLLDLAFVLVRPGHDAVPAVQTPYGTAALHPRIHAQLLRVLHHASGPLPLRTLRAAAGLEAQPLAAALDVLAGLVAQGLAFPVFPVDAPDPATAASARRINRVVAERARQDDLLGHLASPVTGHAVSATRAERLFLAAWEGGAREAPSLAFAAAAVMGISESTEPADLLGEAERFIGQVVPFWRRLGILD